MGFNSAFKGLSGKRCVFYLKHFRHVHNEKLQNYTYLRCLLLD